MKLEEVLDPEELDRLVAETYITARDHPALPYKILNYTPKAQYERNWTRETERSRGLMYDTRDGTIVGKAFDKFFNWGEREVAIPDELFVAYEKYDGSLGISYVDADGLPSVATRGSFSSYQAKRGTQILRSKYAHTLDKILALGKVTLCFEIILPEYRIVVDYQGREDLVLLAAFDLETGQEIDLDDPRLAGLGFPLARRYAATTLDEARELIEGPLFDNAEGVVVRFAGGLRLKLKREEYMRLHRIVTGVTPRRVWEMLKDGSPPVERLFAGTPAPFQTWARTEVDKIEHQRAEIEGASQEAYRQIVAAVRPAIAKRSRCRPRRTATALSSSRCSTTSRTTRSSGSSSALARPTRSASRSERPARNAQTQKHARHTQRKLHGSEAAPQTTGNSGRPADVGRVVAGEARPVAVVLISHAGGVSHGGCSRHRHRLHHDDLPLVYAHEGLPAPEERAVPGEEHRARPGSCPGGHAAHPPDGRACHHRWR